MSELVTVRVRDCKCPGTPHGEGDEIYVAPTISLEGGLQAEQDRGNALIEVMRWAGPRPDDGYPEATKEAMAVRMGEALQKTWLITYVRYGAKGWNLTQPFDIEAILADYNLARPVADKCDELYGGTVNLPLFRRPPKPSPRGRTPRKTSPKTSTRKPNGSSSPVNGPAGTTPLIA